MGGGSSNTSQTTSVEPPEYLKPYYLDIAQRTSAALPQVSNDPYSGDLIANADRAELGGLVMQENFLNNTMGQSSDIARAMLGNVENVANGSMLDPNSNPAFQGMVDATLQPLQENLFEQVLPQIRDQTIGQGAFGGSRHGLLEAQALQNYNQDASNLVAGLAYDNYASERAAQLQAPGLYQDALLAGLAPAQQLQGVGQDFRETSQLGLDNDYELFNLNQQLPFAGLGEAASILTAGNYSTSSSSGKSGKGGLF